MNETAEKTPENSEDVRNRTSPRKLAHIITFGCQMNRHDSQIVGGLLEKAGYGPADGPETADVVLFHTCCVRDHAEQRLYSRISQLRRLKADRPNLVLGVGGCVAQKEKHALAERFPHVDIVFGTSAINDIVSLIRRVEQGERPVVETPEDGPEPRSHLALESDPARIHAFVSIMRGCDNYCSYCVVPYVRGAQRSKRPNEVLEEARALAGQGVVEITGKT
jgi:tRNA-2-methylthio-N6-dimethylallyladenosine synthase